MKARDKARVAALRMVNAEIKRVEVDQRGEPLDDGAVLTVLNRMVKQRKDALQQFQDAGRQDLADQERFEIDVISGFMPAQLEDSELERIVSTTIAEVGATSMKDMGKVMGALSGPLKGRADMSVVSARVKALLG